jgi:hypothetical protein
MNKKIYKNKFNSYDLSNIEKFINKKNWNKKDIKLDKEIKFLCHIETLIYYFFNLNDFNVKYKKEENIIIIE